MQSKRQSLLEANANTFVGLAISYGISFLVYPLLGMGGDYVTYGAATAIFTLVSISRNYALRRAFNWWQHCR